MNIADVFFGAHLDDAGLQVDAVRAGDKAGATLGAKMGAAASLALRGGLAAISADAGIALAGMRQLSTAQADFQAETGATAAEAKAAGDAINAMAGKNIQPIEEIGRALTKVHVDMGLTGKEAEDTTQLFLRFGRAVKQDAGEAVVAFDDILDNWGLQAKDAKTIMDKLIVSHQKYGGAIDKNEATLAKLAPAMRAANFTIDDGIALLGLFGSKGLDADQATAAFAKSLTKVKSPAELQALITDISNTEDPFLRAQKAADLFGAKAGAKLANALGGVDFQSFTIGTDEAAGAMEKAATAADSSFGAQAQLRLKAFSSWLVGLGKDFGPVLTGMAGLAALGGAMGLDKIVIKGLKAVAASGPVKAAAAAAGGITGAIYEEAWLRAAVGIDAVKGLIAKVGASGPVQAASAAAGTTIGKAVGAAARVALIGAIVLGLVEAGDQIIGGVLSDIQRRINDAIAAGSVDDLAKLEDELQRRIDASRRAHVSGPAFDALQKDLAIVKGEIASLGPTAAGVAGHVGKAMDDVATVIGDSAAPIGSAADKVAEAIKAPITSTIDDILSYIKGKRQALTTAATDAGEAIYGPITARANLAQTERDLAEQRTIASSKKSTAAQVADAQARITDLNMTKLEQLAILAAYGDTAAQDALQTQIDILSATKGLTEEQVLELAKLQAALDATRRHADSLLSRLNSIVRTRAGDPNFGPVVGHHAAGGYAPAHVPSIVGELGPELFVPSVSGNVIPAALTKALGALTGGGIGAIHLTVNAGSDVSLGAARQFGATILDTVAEGLREQRARFVGSIP